MPFVVVLLLTSLPPSTAPTGAFGGSPHNRALRVPEAKAPRLDVFHYLTPPLGDAGETGLAPPRAPAPEIKVVEPAVRSESPYKTSLIIDGAITATAFALVGMAEFGLKPEMSSGLHCATSPGQSRCSGAGLNGLDRAALGLHSESWASVTDAALGIAIGGAVAGVALEVLLSGSNTKLRDMLSDLLVLAESVGAVALVTTGLKFAVRRDRPSHYDPSQPLGGPDAAMSFPSGHTSVVSAAAFAFATNFWLRHPESPWRWVVSAGAAGATALTGLGRVQAGRHFPTDVLVGGLIGIAGGIGIPLLHHVLRDDDDPRGGMKSVIAPATMGEDGRGLSWTLRF